MKMMKIIVLPTYLIRSDFSTIVKLSSTSNSPMITAFCSTSHTLLAVLSLAFNISIIGNISLKNFKETVVF